MQSRYGDRRQGGPRSEQTVDELTASAEDLLRTGKLIALCELGASLGDQSDRRISRFDTLLGIAQFELGKVNESLSHLQRVLDAVSGSGPDVQFQAALALFSRESQFLSPDLSLPSLTRLRQLAATTGTAASLGHLHLVVARMEGTRGHCINARRHAATATGLLTRANSAGPGLNLVHASLRLPANSSKPA